MHVQGRFVRRILSVCLLFVALFANPSALLAQPQDTTPPSVSITTPTGAAPVKGTVTVSATAYDNGSVVGLLFQVNGIALGSELTSGGCIGGLSAAVDWNTASAPDGHYSIVATARDSGGNVTASTPVTVAVVNTPQPSPPPGSPLPPSPVPSLPTSPIDDDAPIPGGGPVPFPGGCITPDPFVALGGGRCVNGGWLPPGLSAPSSGSTPAPSLPAPPPAGPVFSAGCVTPDPFVVLGGGRCVSGSWLPPGMLLAGIDPTPSLPAPSPSTPAPPSPGFPGGCRTSDPFVLFGGGRCINGNWLPPGMIVVATDDDAPVVAPPPGNVGNGDDDDRPPPLVTGCLIPDPFRSIPSLIGVCVNGGWIPILR